MMDQKAKFAPQGIITEFLGEEQTDVSCIRSVKNGEVQLVYMSPESIICNFQYRNMILSPVYQEKLVAFVVDEAHCVKKWLVTLLSQFYQFLFIGVIAFELHILS